MRTATYRARRNSLRARLNGRALFLGNTDAPRNYLANPYPFRQDSHLLYFCGIQLPGFALIVDASSGRDVLYGPERSVDDVVWHGAQLSLEDLAARAGVDSVRDLRELGGDLERSTDVQWLPPYRAATRERLAELLRIQGQDVTRSASRELAQTVASLRLVKEPEEIAEIENALGVTHRMHLAAFAAARPGARESDVVAAVESVATADGRVQAYNPIITVRGEVLHNHAHSNVMSDGDLLLNDSGAESAHGYASDITRTFPVSGRFDARQRAVYEIVLAAQASAITATGPGRAYVEAHRQASLVISEGLIGIGIMRGDAEAAVAEGAHALFFPHGLGHMLGLDVHDMEDLGEDIVGYDEGQTRSAQFGLCHLRCARRLVPGNVVTSEPGIYFIPALIDRWNSDKRCDRFINYDALGAWRNFGGIRIEDDVLVTEDGARVLGPRIPKTVAEVESAMQS